MRLRWDGIIARLSYRFNFLAIRAVGWDFLQQCREVRLIYARQSDFEVMADSVNKRRFEGCKTLTIVFGHGFDFSLIATLFPEVETITIERSSGVHLDGMSGLPKLREVWFENCTQVVQLDEYNIPPGLRDLVFFRSVNPIVKTKPDWLQVHTEKLSKDNILLH
jgi:hypothetical protein